MLHHHDSTLQVPVDGGALIRALIVQTPWWMISVTFHGLLIVLVGLVSLTIGTNEESEPLVTQSEIGFRAFNEGRALPSGALTEALVPATYCPNSTESNVVDLCNEFKAISKDDHFMTLDSIRAESDDAGGNRDSKIMFNSLQPGSAKSGSGNGGPSYLEEMISASGAHVGFGSGRIFVSGNDSGIGCFSLSGSNQFGRLSASRYKCICRIVRRGCATPCISATDGALRWLAFHQEPDGRWDTTKRFGATHKNDAAVTGLSLLALLGAGHSEKVGDYKDTISLGVKWLIQHQRADGLIADDTDDQAAHRKGGYPMAIATLALCEAAGMANVPETRTAAQKAVDYCVNIHQAGSGSDKRGWRYAPNMEGDLSVTGWFIMALKSAKIAGLHVDPAAFDGAIKFLDSVEIVDKSLDPGHGPVSRYKYTTTSEHADSAHRLTAIGTVARQFMGWKKEDLQGSVDWFLEKGGYPAWGANGEKVDLYYWYYGSLAAFQQGGPEFSKWSDAMLDAFLPNQIKVGDDDGSWDPVGEYASEWGRVGQTALSALCLEVYYRYPKINK